MRSDVQIPAVGIEDLASNSVTDTRKFHSGDGAVVQNAMPQVGESELVKQWNQTQADYPREKAIHQLFAEQVARTPDAVATAFEDKQLTFRELDAAAEQLAGPLAQCGVGANTLVGVCVPRSLEMLVGLLAILKAGGAYIPLDPAYPKERIEFMVADAQIKVLLTTQTMQEKFGFSTLGCRIVFLDAKPEAANVEQRTSNIHPGTRSEDLAYVLYTSGSTGKPKGVMVRHRNVVNFFAGMDRVIGPECGVWLAVTSISFDISVLESFWTLTRGFKVVIQGEEWNAKHSIAENIARHAVTHLQCTPSQATLLIEDTQSFQALKRIRKLFLGGEALPPALVQRLAGVGELYNMYGPTETTIWSAATKLVGADVTIGRPIVNTQVHIVDENLRPVGIGEAGELLIGGDGVALGYLNRPELTSEKFIHDPFCGSAGNRGGAAFLYRTGDLARWRADGNIEFLGRLDNQIKLRGHRVELGEVEAVLTQHPAVQRAIVSVREDAPGDQRLVAYVVPHDNAANAETLGQWQTIWDGAYARRDGAADPTFNISGWRSSYTGEPIPADEMRQWVGDTVEKILATQPKSILEIGCGTGLLLFQLAPHCERYCATDFSQTALAELSGILKTREPKLPITLLRQRADNFEGIAPNSFDTVVLNSVVQYFPNAGYFVHVLQNAMRAVKPGGHIFIGDVRNLVLLEEFYASIELHQDDGELTVADLKKRVQRRVERETELVFAPEFFHALRTYFPQIGSVDLHLKTGRYQNEMTRFRYDVVLHVAGSPQAQQEMASLPRELKRYVNCPSASVATGTLSRELRERLKQQLPDFMVPSAIVLLEEFPLTPNGKVDRKALPKPVASARTEEVSIAPESELEKIIAEIWKEVLQVEQVGFNENFFDLGGHSLLLAQVHSRLRQTLGVDLPILKLFQFPTVHSLAEALGTKTETTDSFGYIRQRALRQRAVLATSNFRFRDHVSCLRSNGTSHQVRA